MNFKTYEELLQYSPIGNGEYLPNNLNLAIDNSNVVDIDNSKNLDYKKDYLKLQATLDDKAGTKIQIPYIYYKGYKAKIIDKNGQEHELIVSQNKDTGLVMVKNQDKISGKLIIEYKMTLVQKISYIISSLTILTIIVYTIIWNRRKKQ